MAETSAGAACVVPCPRRTSCGLKLVSPKLVPSNLTAKTATLKSSKMIGVRLGPTPGMSTCYCRVHFLANVKADEGEPKDSLHLSGKAQKKQNKQKQQDLIVGALRSVQ